MKSEHELQLERTRNRHPPTNKEVAALVEYVKKRIKELKATPSLVELEDFMECLRIKLPVLTEDQAMEIVRLALHNVPVQNSITSMGLVPNPSCETIPLTTGRPSKLTPEQKVDALQRLGSGETQADVAKSYGVDATIIGRLRSDKWNLKG
jgi:hypothetical protein